MVSRRPFAVFNPAQARGPAPFALLLAIAIALLPTSCAINPVSGDAEVILISEEEEREIDAEAAEQVAAEMGLVESAELRDYVDAIGQRLASQSPRQGVEWVFNVVEMDEPNAFALPGGHIYVSRGLIVLSNSEAELANVIGHEIGHVAARHAAQRDARAKTIGLLTLLGTVAAAAGGAGEVAAGLGQFGGIAGAGLLAAYGRDQEREADRIGQELCAGAGVDPAGMPAFLRTLDKATRLQRGSSRLPSFLDTHPATPERVAETITRAAVLRWEPDFAIAPTREAYLRSLDGMAVEKPASEGVLQGDRFSHVELGISLRFPRGWSVANQRARVIAVPPRRDAMLVLELQGEGEDPSGAAREFAEEHQIELVEPGPLRIGSLAAFRAYAAIESSAGPTAAMITWVAHDGNIYRLIGGTAGGSFGRYEGVFRSFARSFRPLRDDEADKIHELRLRLAFAERDETLAELSRRTRNEWDLNRTAVLNDLFVHQTLRQGHLVKIAVSELYRPTPPTPPTPRVDESGEREAGPRPEASAEVPTP